MKIFNNFKSQQKTMIGNNSVIHHHDARLANGNIAESDSRVAKVIFKKFKVGNCLLNEVRVMMMKLIADMGLIGAWHSIESRGGMTPPLQLCEAPGA